MSKTLTLEGDVNAVDTRVLLTAQGSVAAPSLVVPSGMTKISRIYAVASHDGAADDGSVVWILRIGGSAVKNGEQTIVFAGGGNQTVQSGSDAAPNVLAPFVLMDADIAVNASDNLSIGCEMAGVDIGDSAVAVTLVYG